MCTVEAYIGKYQLKVKTLYLLQTENYDGPYHITTVS